MKYLSTMPNLLGFQFINNTSFQIHYMTCRGICARYKASKSNSYSSHYALGNKRCSRCEVFIKWDGIHCPCCKLILRTSPKGTSGRNQLLLVRQSRK